MDLGLNGRSVLVTGASRGIGRAIAEAFAAEGAALHLVARGVEGLQRASEEIARDHGATATTLAVDLAQPGATETLFETCPNAEIVINNAGGIPGGDLLALSDADWRAGWESKVFGYIDLTRLYFGAMKERRRGVIINIIGVAAERLDYNYAAGSAGNAGLVALTRAVGSYSLDHGVRVLGVNPGYVATERATGLMRRRAESMFGDAERWRELTKNLPAQRMLEPKEIADVVVFLASDRASGVSGEVLSVDGGLAIRH
ncbi:MAG: short-chain dehydrogenase/reductase [Vulcanimicrobiaceae bacterium]|jgi:NAD(P)-dependent dehydrogenase (short-subunit alcohol dehydrogenase family)